MKFKLLALVFMSLALSSSIPAAVDAKTLAQKLFGVDQGADSDKNLREYFNKIGGGDIELGSDRVTIKKNLKIDKKDFTANDHTDMNLLEYKFMVDNYGGGGGDSFMPIHGWKSGVVIGCVLVLGGVGGFFGSSMLSSEDDNE